MIQSTPTPRNRFAGLTARSPASVRSLPWSWAVVGVLAVVTFIARSPGIVYTGLFDRDEAFLQVMGRVLGQGGEMYVDVIDRKPPIVPYLYAAVRELSVDMRYVRLLCALLIMVNGVVIVALVTRLTADRRASLAAGVLAVVGTSMFLPADAQAANFELWALLPASTAVLLVVSARDSRWPRLGLLFAAGICVAVAAHCKQPFIVVTLPVVYEALRRREHRVRAVLAVGSGMVMATLPLLLAVDPSRMLRWGWADNSDYLNGGISTTRALAVGAGLTLVFALFHLPLLYGLWAAFTRRVRIDPVLVVWLGASVLVLPIGLRFFGHYYQQLVPPLAAITGVALVTASRLVWRSVATLTTLLTLILVGLAFVHPADLSNFTAVGRYVQRTTEPTDRILVWGALPDVYVSADRPPAGVFLHGGYLTGNWASRAEVLDASVIDSEPFRSRWVTFMNDLERHPPVVIIDAARPGTDWAGYGTDRYPLGALMQRCYVRAAVLDGLPVWRRDTTLCPT